MKVAFVVFALIALAASQCSFEGYNFEHTESNEGLHLTFGDAVGHWVPAIEEGNGENSAYFVAFQVMTSARLTIRDWGSSIEGNSCDEDIVGQYTYSWSPNCHELHLSVIDDECSERAETYDGAVLHRDDPNSNADCMTAGVQMHSQFGESDLQPRLSEESITITQGVEGFVVISVSDTAAIWQHWTEDFDRANPIVRIIDIASAPMGYTCDHRRIGDYFVEFDDECNTNFCGDVDSCTVRAELMHDIETDEWDGGECVNDVEQGDDDLEYDGGACSDGRQWRTHPYECVDQGDGAQCMFCRGLANDLDVSLCLEREGAECDDIFESAPGRAWCNLEFECPASSVTMPFLLIASVVVALFAYF